MRKSLVVFFLLAILAVCSLPVALLTISSQKESVVITENILIGNGEAAEGVTVQLNTHYADRLLWETEARLGEDMETDTEFTFHASDMVYEQGNRDNVEIYTITGFGSSSSGDVLYDDIMGDIYYKKVFANLAEDMEPGDTLTRVVNLADYYEYFQISGNIYNDEYIDGYSYVTEREISYKLSEMISMKIPKDMQVEVSLTKNLAGEVCDINMNPYANAVGLYGVGTVLPDACYFSVYASEDETGALWEEYKDSIGIYKIPVKNMVSEFNPDRSFRGLDWENTELVYPMEGSILEMETDESQENLYILFRKEEELYIQVLDLRNMELIQEIHLESANNTSVCSTFYVNEEGILIILDRNDGHIYYLERQDDGKLHMVIDVDALQYQLFENYNRLDNLEYDYHNGKLALIWQADYYRSVNVYVMVVNRDAIQYLAKLDNSLDIAGDSQIRFHETTPYKISWNSD